MYFHLICPTGEILLENALRSISGTDIPEEQKRRQLAE